MKVPRLLKNNILLFSLLSFVFTASTALSLSKIEIENQIDLKQVFSNKTYEKLPTLKNESISFPILSAQAVLAVDLDSSKTLFEKNPDASLFPASTTKIVTALVSTDYYNLDDVITIKDPRIDGQKMGLQKGEEMKVEDLLYGLLIYSANDAAEVLAQNYCEKDSTPSIPLVNPYQDKTCGEDVFVSRMNKLAHDLHLTNTNFTNPSGLDNPNHISTARDLVRVAKYAMKNKEFAKIVSTKELLVQSIDGKTKHKLVNINELVGQVDGVLGIKTGWTENARENLITYIKRDDHEIIIALLGSQDRFGETKELINWIFDNYEWKEIQVPQ